MHGLRLKSYSFEKYKTKKIDVPKKNQNFYQNLTAALQIESETFPHLNVSVKFHYLETQDPSEHAECLRALGREVDVIAASTVDHSHVDRAVSDLVEQGIPVFAFLNDFSLTDIALEHGTPLYVYDWDNIENNIFEFTNGSFVFPLIHSYTLVFDLSQLYFLFKIPSILKILSLYFIDMYLK